MKWSPKLAVHCIYVSFVIKQQQHNFFKIVDTSLRTLSRNFKTDNNIINTWICKKFCSFVVIENSFKELYNIKSISNMVKDKRFIFWSFWSDNLSFVRNRQNKERSVPNWFEIFHNIRVGRVVRAPASEKAVPEFDSGYILFEHFMSHFVLIH